jgi:hypothetical protein
LGQERNQRSSEIIFKLRHYPNLRTISSSKAGIGSSGIEQLPLDVLPEFVGIVGHD